MIALGYDDVDGFVAKNKHKGIDVRWDGWTMVFFQPHKAARRSANGRFRNGEYGFETRVSPNRQGNWLVNKELVQRVGRGN